VKKKILERDVTKAVRDVLKAGRVWHFKHWSGMGSYPGVPDILGVYRVKVEDLIKWNVKEIGVFLAIEVKAPGGTATEKQSQFLQEVRDNGGFAFTADSPEVVIKKLGLFGKIMPLFKKEA